MTRRFVVSQPYIAIDHIGEVWRSVRLLRKGSPQPASLELPHRRIVEGLLRTQSLSLRTQLLLQLLIRQQGQLIHSYVDRVEHRRGYRPIGIGVTTIAIEGGVFQREQLYDAHPHSLSHRRKCLQGGKVTTARIAVTTQTKEGNGYPSLTGHLTHIIL